MKKRSCLFLAFLLVISPGCSRKGPDDEGAIAPVSLDVEIELRFQPSWEEFESRAGVAENPATADLRRRFVVEIRTGETLVLRRSIAAEPPSGNGEAFVLPGTFPLQPQQYTLAVWSDYTQSGSTDDLHYDTSDFRRITVRQPAIGDTDRREGLYATRTIDLRPFAGGSATPVRTTAEMIRPQAGYRIVATDAEAFLKLAGRVFPGQTAFGVRISYDFYLPAAFNVPDGKPADSRAGTIVEGTISLPPAGSEEWLLASDLFFAGEADSHLPLTVEIVSLEDNSVIGRLPGLDVPYRRGAVTTLRGRFAGALFGSGGVSIDTDFDGDLNHIIPKL
jgi:hypothetical protein